MKYLKYVSETLAKTHIKTLEKAIAKHITQIKLATYVCNKCNIQISTLAIYV